MAEAFTAAVCQMCSGKDRAENLERAKALIARAKVLGADVVVLPEYMAFNGKGYKYQGESLQGETVTCLRKAAARHGLWIVGGTFPLENEGAFPYNTLLVISPDGEIRCSYSKLHLFDIHVDGAPKRGESGGCSPGDRIVLLDTPFGRWGFAICYDLRFGELFRLQAEAGADVIFMPSSFTRVTGEAHWEVLIRARAIENSVYILAPDQAGESEIMEAYGHSMIVDPSGKVLAQARAEEEVLLARIDPELSGRLRRQFAVFDNRRPDMYQLSSDKISCL